MPVQRTALLQTPQTVSKRPKPNECCGKKRDECLAGIFEWIPSNYIAGYVTRLDTRITVLMVGPP